VTPFGRLYDLTWRRMRHFGGFIILARDVMIRVVTPPVDGSEVVRQMEAMGVQSANLATLQRIISHMLESTDVDQALHAMLSGITSGRGLGFNRAALFIHDEARQTYVGAKAIGPADAREASRIWEEIEYADLSIDHLITSYEPARFDTPFQRFIQGLELQPAEPGDEVAPNRRLRSSSALVRASSPMPPGEES